MLLLLTFSFAVVQGPGLYYVDNDGTRLKGNLFSGSGSTLPTVC